MDKNLLLAVSLSVLVYAAWFGFIEKRITPPLAGGQRTERPIGKDVAAHVPPEIPTRSEKPSVDRAAISAESDEVRLGKIEGRIHPKGASLVSALYREPLGDVELVADPAPGFLATWPELVFKRSPAAPGSAAYQAARPDGLLISKEFIPEGESALARLRITLTNPTKRALESGPWTLSLGPGLGTVPSEQEENPKVWRALGLLFGGQGLKGKVEDFKPGEHAGPYRWIGIDNRYFLAAVLPKPEELSGVSSGSPPAVTLAFKGAALAPGEAHSWEIPYYLGTKGHTWLSRYGEDLERSIDFGFFAQLGRWVLGVLYKIFRLTGNWGWSIILLTVMLQVVLMPLTYKSLKSAAAMKKLQPEIAKLQQKYSKEPSRLNSEMMDLYKKSGANPLGGCLPMLLQMPIFIALYNALRNAWELHGASWIFWIKDLSAKDPYYALPLIMGALMFGQNKLNPAATDPTQAKMMTMMPIIFTFMFLNFPAGLVLYWLTNSLMSTLMQLALRNHFDGPAAK